MSYETRPSNVVKTYHSIFPGTKRYTPRPDFWLGNPEFPFVLAEFQSNLPGEEDKFRMMFQLACLVRYAYAAKVNMGTLYLMGFFFTKDKQVERFIFYGVPKEGNEAEPLFKEDTFEVSKGSLL